MAKFLVKYDFYKLIDETNIDELTDSTDRILNDAIDAAVEETASYIRHRYDEDAVFAAVNEYDETVTYEEGDRVFWKVTTEYSIAATYSEDDIVVYSDSIYQANQDINPAEAWTPAHWDLLAENNTFYTCTAESTGNLPTDTVYFSAGDDRNAKIVQIVTDITLYNLHSKISPRSVPEVRRIRYDGDGRKRDSENAITTLEKIQKGTITPNLPIISTDPDNSHRVISGSTSDSAYKY